jgi:xylose dehydrogenase (NAD/NADP)
VSGNLASATRLGLLSTARINQEILAGAAASDKVDVVAVGSRDRARAEVYAREHGLARAHGSYDDLLADTELDAVYISLPNGLHHEWAMRALRAGKHVLCEKPYSRDPTEVLEAFDLADSVGCVLTEAFMYRHHPQTAAVKRILEENRIGRVRLVRAAFSFKLNNESDVRLAPALMGGALMDVGCYCISGARLVAGEPKRVESESVIGPTGVDLAFYGMLRFPGDVVAQFEASFVAPRRQELVVVGDGASLVVRAPWRVDWGGSVEIHRDGAVERVDIPAGNSYALQLDNFANAIAGSERVLLDRDDALGQARVIEALYRAADAGVSITL